MVSDLLSSGMSRSVSAEGSFGPGYQEAPPAPRPKASTASSTRMPRGLSAPANRIMVHALKAISLRWHNSEV